MLHVWFERIRRAALLLVVLAVGSYVALGLVIGKQVDRAVAEARHHHEGDAFDALLATATDPSIDLALRDSAIWALGQIGDAAAVPTLRTLETGEECDHANAVCQRGLRRAIASCDGSVNLTAPLWRRGEFAAR